MVVDEAMPGPGDLWAVRHGQSTANLAFARAIADGREETGIQGRDADVPLAPAGRSQAAAVGRWFAGLPDGSRPSTVFVSPYLRARQTLDLVLEHQPPGAAVQIRVDERLRDREMGVLELLTPAAVERRFPDEARRRRQVGEISYRPPGGESLWDVARRLRDFARDLDAEAHPGVLVIGHDATVLMLRSVTEELGADEVDALMTDNPVRNASITHWRRAQNRWTLQTYNSTHHLSDTEG